MRIVGGGLAPALRRPVDVAMFGVVTTLERPVATPRRSGWVLVFVGGWLLSQVVGAVTYLAVGPAFVVRGTASGVRAAEVLDDSALAITAGAPLIALALLQLPVWAVQLAAVATATTARSRSWRDDLGLRVRAIDGLVGAVAGVGTQLLIGVLYRMVDIDADGPAQQLTSKGRGVVGLVGMLVLLALCAPVVEELLFRGVLQGGLASRLPRPLAVVIAAAVFALVHYQPVQFPGLLVAGLVFGSLAMRSGRLGPAVVAHITFNATTVIALWAS